MKKILGACLSLAVTSLGVAPSAFAVPAPRSAGSTAASPSAHTGYVGAGEAPFVPIAPRAYSSQGLCFTGGGSQIRSYPF